MTHVKVNFVSGNLSNSAAAEDKAKAALAKKMQLQKMLFQKDFYSADSDTPKLPVMDYDKHYAAVDNQGKVISLQPRYENAA